MKTVTTHPAFAALTGTLFMLPLLAANAIVGNRIEPFFSLMRPGVHTSPREYVLLVFVLLLLPAGAFIALRPVLNRRAGERRAFRVVNGSVAVFLLVVFVSVSIGWGLDVYRCDIQQIPNCD